MRRINLSTAEMVVAGEAETGAGEAETPLVAQGVTVAEIGWLGEVPSHP
ncbi:MAG: hypothetical protein ACTHW1_00145 [Ancrocorticia sp.]